MHAKVGYYAGHAYREAGITTAIQELGVSPFLPAIVESPNFTPSLSITPPCVDHN